MKGRIKDMGFGLTGELSVTLSLPREHAQEVQGLLDKDLSVEMKRWRNRRSLDANALMWTICRDIAEALNKEMREQGRGEKQGRDKREALLFGKWPRKEKPYIDKDVYRKAVLEIGPHMPVPIKEEAVEDLKERWAKNGIAWLVEVEDDSKLKGYKRVRLYYGSSTYNTLEMSRLLDCLMADAWHMNLALEATPAQVEEAKRRWGDA